MNFLAHLYLADDTPASRIGNLLPDLVRVRRGQTLDPEVARGADMHRRVDAFTDTHPVFLRSRERLFDRHGRYSGILVDLFYDHLLAGDWPRWRHQPLDAFLDEVYQQFAANRHLMPEKMWRTVQRMTGQNWLAGYAHLEGMRATLEGMSHRLSSRFNRHVDLTPAIDDLVALRAPLQTDFDIFFPALIAFARPRHETQRDPTSKRTDSSADSNRNGCTDPP